MEQVKSPDGTNLGLHISGHGPVLLLVHGTTADHTRWLGVTSYFESHFKVFNMDRRGRGASGDGPSYRIEREAEDVAAVVEFIGEPVAVLGHSYGAVCSLEAALLTDGISRMALYEPPLPTGVPMYPDGVPDQMQSLLDDGEPERALEMFFVEVVRMPDHELEKYRQLPMWQRRVELAATIPRELAIDRSYEFVPAKFAELQLPVALLLGGDSPEMFRSAITAAKTALPNAIVEVLSGEQHIAMDTNPELFVAKVLGFLRD